MLLAGTYERFLFGFKVTSSVQQESEQQLVKACTYAAHQNAVKCVAAGGYLVASGGADDQIHLYDLKHGKDLGFLMNPGDGAVPCIQFYCPPNAGGAPSHMFSGSADGSISLWRAGGGWEHLKLMKGHKGSVNSLTVHPSGRLALSVAHDCTLRMWDLAKGHSHFCTDLDLEGEVVEFTPSGDSYVLVSGQKVTVHSAAGEGQLMAKFEHTRRVSSVTQLNEHVVVAGLEDGSFKVWDTRSSSLQLSQERAHATRVRGLVCIRSGAGDTPQHLGSAASDGVIKLWDVRALSSASSTAKAGGSSQALACVAEVATRARITCLTVANLTAPGPKPPPKAPAPKVPEPELAADTKSAGTKQKKPVAGQAAGAQKAGKPGQAAQQASVQKKQRDKPVPKRPQNPGFEVVSEQQQEVKKQRRQERLEDSDDESGQDELMPRAKNKGQGQAAKTGKGVSPSNGKGAGKNRQKSRSQKR